MASSTYASDYLQGWADANAGLYSPPGTILLQLLTDAARGYEFETRRGAYEEGYRDHEGHLKSSPLLRSESNASR